MKDPKTITAKFANLNKNNTLAEYENEVNKGDYITVRCKVEKYIVVNSVIYNSISNNLLEDNKLYAGLGGSEYTGDKYPEMYEEDFNWSKLYNNEDMMNDFRDNSILTVVIIENETTGDMLAIDPQGYNYARYVGINVTVLT